MVLSGFTQIASHSRGNPSHHRASARMPSPFFRKIILPCLFVSPLGTAPRPLFFLERAPSPHPKNMALRCHEESQKKRVICDAIRRSSVLWLGCLCVFLNHTKKSFGNGFFAVGTVPRRFFRYYGDCHVFTITSISIITSTPIFISFS